MIATRMLGRYANGLGMSYDDKRPMKFYDGSNEFLLPVGSPESHI